MPVFTHPLATRTYEVDIHTVDLLVPPNHAFPRPRPFPRLHPYQELAARQLMDQKNSALIADYFSGGIEIASETASTYLDQEDIKRVIILTRPSSLTHWSYLTNVMGYTDVWVPSGAPGQRWRNYATCNARFFVVPYSLLSRDVEALFPLMASSLLILDDVSQLRTRNATRTNDAHRLSQCAAARLTVIQAPHQYNMDEWNLLMWTALDPTRQDRETTCALARHLRGMTPPAGVVTVTSKD